MTLFDPLTQGGFCHFIHWVTLAGACDRVSDVTGPATDHVGGVYASYVIPQFTERFGDAGATIYYVMSTWNPYEVVLMRSSIVFADVPATRPPTSAPTSVPTTTSTIPAPTRTPTPTPRPGSIAVTPTSLFAGYCWQHADLSFAVADTGGGAVELVIASTTGAYHVDTPYYHLEARQSLVEPVHGSGNDSIRLTWHDTRSPTIIGETDVAIHCDNSGPR